MDEFIVEFFKFKIQKLFKKHFNLNKKIYSCEHHVSHASSAFYTSPFERSAILTIDGVGEWATASYGIGKDNKINILGQMDFPNSIGILYSAFTFFTGFKVNSGEYKLMGLAPYGKPVYKNDILNNVLKINPDGTVKLNMNYFSFRESELMTSKKMNTLLEGPPRKKESEITERELNIASSIQSIVEDIVITIAKHVKNKTKMDNLCIAGGVALNCVANGKLLKSNVFNKIYIQPAAGDAGCSLGAALAYYYSKSKVKRIPNKINYPDMQGSYLGPKFSNNEIDSFLISNSIPYKKLSKSKRSEIVAKLISDGNVIGHFSGRMEFGPRALGSRSILGDPRNINMQKNINLKIKYRESFRPFAPSVLAEDSSKFFDIKVDSPYMLLVAPVLKKRRLKINLVKNKSLLDIVKIPKSDIPAVTHVDYSARIQSVDKKYNKKYYDIIKSFKKITGFGLIINTSFNVRGEPIVCSPSDAYNCFMNTNMDVLVLEDRLLLKKDQPEYENKLNYLNKYELD